MIEIEPSLTTDLEFDLEYKIEAKNKKQAEDFLNNISLTSNKLKDNEDCLNIYISAHDHPYLNISDFINKYYPDLKFEILGSIKIPNHIKNVHYSIGVGQLTINNLESILNMEIGAGDLDIQNTKFLGESNINLGSGNIKIDILDMEKNSTLNLNLGAGDIDLDLLKSLNKSKINVNAGVANSNINISKSNDYKILYNGNILENGNDKSKSIIEIQTTMGDINIKEK